MKVLNIKNLQLLTFLLQRKTNFLSPFNSELKMIRFFDKYTVKILNKSFKVNEIQYPKTVIITFFDKNEVEIEKQNLAFLDIETYKKIQPSKKEINISNCYIKKEVLDFIKVKNTFKKKILFHNFSAENSFFDFKEDQLNLSNIKYLDNLNFKKSIIIASKIDFSNSKFAAKNIDFSYTLFKTNEFSINNAEFSKGDLSFKNAIFSDSKKHFKQMQFKKGKKIFENVQFGNGEISFFETNFNKGKVTFKISSFGKGRKNFADVNFGTDETSFDKTSFGEGDITFRNATFLNDKVHFTGAIFGNGRKDFSNADFGHGNIIFKSCDFKNGKVTFRSATFGEGFVDFHYSEFGKGDIIFDFTKFNNGGIDFSNVNFGSGKLNFNKAFLGNGDINFEASSLIGNFKMQDSVFGRGEFNFENAYFDKACLEISNVEFGLGKVSFRNSSFDTLILKESQLDNFFDLRISKCNKLDLSETIVKDILDINPQENKEGYKEINLSGMRLLGRIYLDWQSNDVKQLIYNQNTSYLNKSEQFRILKENYNLNGQYSYEDKAYVEFKRCEAKAVLEIEKQKSKFFKIKPHLNYYFKWLIFDKMGKYATDPLRVLSTMLITYIIFTFIYIIIAKFGNIHILSSLFAPDDPRVLSPVGKAFYHSAITFLTIGYGDYYPVGISRWISAIEGFVGLFQMSYFTVAFVRKVLR